MAIDDLAAYNATLTYLTNAVEIIGFPCTVFRPLQNKTFGYENRGESLETDTGVSRVKEVYSKRVIKLFIDFNPSRQTYYKFNYFPEDSEKLVMIYSAPNSFIKENCYVRTANSESVSPWGDLIFSIPKVVSIGKYKVLNRQYFGRPVASFELADLLNVEEAFVEPSTALV